MTWLLLLLILSMIAHLQTYLKYRRMRNWQLRAEIRALQMKEEFEKGCG